MKKTVVLVLGLALAAFLPACKSEYGKLEYSQLGGQLWLSAKIVRKADGKPVMGFHLRDLKEELDQQDIIKEFRRAKDSVGGHPAEIVKDRSVKVLVAERYEIQLIAENTDPKYRNTDKLKDFIQSFDLGGLEKQKKGRLSPKELEKFIPKLDKNVK